MTCSFDTMLTTVLTSFILYLIVSFLFINSKRILIVGYRTVVYICLLSILRLVLSIEFSFSVHINLNTFFSSVIFFFRQHHTFFHFFKISLWDIIVIIWGVGIIIHLYKYWNQYQKDKWFIYNIGINVSHMEKYSSILNSVCNRYHLDNVFQIYEILGISSPMIFSMHKPIILLPIENEYSVEELTFIFRHEVGHFRNHHLLYQLFIQLFFTIYWWNPFNKHIEKRLNILLETSIDHSFLSSKQETSEYLTCLLKVKKSALTLNTSHIPKSLTLSMSNFQETSLEKRFQLLTNSHKHNKLLSFALCIGCTGIFIFSYYFTLKGDALPTELASDECFILTSNNAYAIRNDNGSFDIYLYGEYLETTNSLEEYGTFPIYDSKEELTH